MAERVILTADDGMMLTNGTDYGRVVWLAEGVDPALYYAIPLEEYEKCLLEAHPESEGSDS